MTRCADCGVEDDVTVKDQPCRCCAGDTTTLEPCPGCDRVPADRGSGFYVTVYVAGLAIQEDAERLVGEMLDVARPGAQERVDGFTADVVPE